MTKEEAIIKIQRLRDEFNETYIGYDGTNEAVDMAIESLRKEEPTEEEIIKYCHNRCLVIITSEAYERIKCGLQPLKRGKWIKMSDADGTYWACSECGEELYRKWTFDREFDLFPKKETIDKTRYCPSCGCYMENKE